LAEKENRMRFRVLTIAGCVVFTQPAAAQTRADSAAFIVRLGVDTTAIERYVRTADRIVIESVQRSPSTSLHRLTLRFGPQGRVAGGEHTVTPAGAAAPTLRRTIEFRGDTAVITTHSGGAPTTQRIAARNAIPLPGPFYAPYELALMGAATATGEQTVPLLTANAVVTVPVARIGRDSMRVQNQFGAMMRAHVDAQGRLLHLSAPGSTTVERLRWVDLDAMAREFARRDDTGRGMGPLSTRQTLRTTVGRANIWLDYGRPAMRGRNVWGDLVPFGAVWRLGANDATHFATDRTLQLGTLTIEPGTYTLSLLPASDRWLLIVNRATGVSGLNYDAAQDVGRVELTRETLRQPAERLTIAIEPTQTAGEARLAISWADTRAFAPIRVR
jgi:hypothetical protein